MNTVNGEMKVGSQWLFKITRLLNGSVEKFKARLVVQGFTQNPVFELDQTYAAIVYVHFLNLLLTIMVIQYWCLLQVDVKCTFFYRDLKE
jgi:hypothetical protein